MALDEAVTSPLAIGIGCRRACAAETIVTLVIMACEGLDRAGAGLFTLAAKRDEAGLLAAAAILEMPLGFLSVAALEEALPGTSIRSVRVQRVVGVASVAEAAALAGAGWGARLIVPRQVHAGATCAVARRFARAMP